MRVLVISALLALAAAVPLHTEEAETRPLRMNPEEHQAFVETVRRLSREHQTNDTFKLWQYYVGESIVKQLRKAWEPEIKLLKEQAEQIRLEREKEEEYRLKAKKEEEDRMKAEEEEKTRLQAVQYAKKQLGETIKKMMLEFKKEFNKRHEAVQQVLRPLQAEWAEQKPHPLEHVRQLIRQLLAEWDEKKPLKPAVEALIPLLEEFQKKKPLLAVWQVMEPLMEEWEEKLKPVWPLMTPLISEWFEKIKRAWEDILVLNVELKNTWLEKSEWEKKVKEKDHIVESLMKEWEEKRPLEPIWQVLRPLEADLEENNPVEAVMRVLGPLLEEGLYKLEPVVKLMKPVLKEWGGKMKPVLSEIEAVSNEWNEKLRLAILKQHSKRTPKVDDIKSNADRLAAERLLASGADHMFSEDFDLRNYMLVAPPAKDQSTKLPPAFDLRDYELVAPPAKYQRTKQPPAPISWSETLAAISKTGKFPDNLDDQMAQQNNEEKSIREILLAYSEFQNNEARHYNLAKERDEKMKNFLSDKEVVGYSMDEDSGVLEYWLVQNHDLHQFL